jgi:signal transduction histidine kinase
LLAYYRLNAQLKASKREREQRALLETLVEERTGELLEANRRLQSEIFQRERLEQEMRVVQKMEAVGRLTGGIAHDFNNLITTITVYSELLRRQLPEGNGELARDVDQITESAQEAAALIQSLLSLSRSGSIETVVLDLNSEVAEMADLIGHLLGEHSQLELQLSDDTCRIRANTDEIHQVLINLVLNARDAMPKGGTLRIEVSPLESSALRPPELLGASSDSAYVVLIVADDGVGMDEETRQRVFDPFFTTKDANRGTGLGLSTVYGIVSQAGGHVRVSSAPGSGSRFELFFPQTAEPLEPRKTPARPAPAEGGRERILLVEDEEDLRQALHRVLAFSGYRVVEASDGAAALDVMESDAQHFDLVVSDVVMPKMSGIELAERLRHLQPDARVLLLSGYLNHESVEEREFPPSAEFLAKPFSPADLTAKVRNVLDS